MQIQTATDLSSYFDTHDFADDVLVGGTYTIKAVLDHSFIESLDINGRQTTLLCIKTDADSIAVGTVVKINRTGNSYTVRAKEDGYHVSRLVLEVI